MQYTVYETFEVQKCYTVRADSEEEAKAIHEKGHSVFSWSETGDTIGETFAELMDTK